MSGRSNTSAGKAVGLVLLLGGIVVCLGSLLVSCASCHDVTTYYNPTTWYSEHKTVWTGQAALFVAFFAFCVAVIGFFLARMFRD